jgi:hypothetical protein
MTAGRARRLEHGVGLTDAGRGTEKDLEASSIFATAPLGLGLSMEAFSTTQNPLSLRHPVVRTIIIVRTGSHSIGLSPRAS